MSGERVHHGLRTFFVCVAAACFFAASTGTLPTSGVLRGVRLAVSGERFPCEAGRCGCTQAAHCWTDCCCLTLPQRLAWAISHEIAVPAYVRFSDEDASQARRLLLARVHSTPTAAASCCPTPAKPAPCCRTSPTTSHDEYTPPTLSPLACKGVNILLFAVLSPAPTGERQTWVDEPRFIGLSPGDGSSPVSCGLDVPVPPPRAA